MTDQVNPLKCYDCGKTFTKPDNLRQHKARKTPCLIHNIAADQLNNPNRCVFCNRVLANKRNKTRHDATCKVKNGGAATAEARHEHEMRLIKEQIDAVKADHAQMRATLDALIAGNPRNENAAAAANTSVAVNSNNTTTTTNNITINNYLTPNMSHIFGEGGQFELLLRKHTNDIATALVREIWFNQNHPENFSLYLVNKNTKEMRIFNGDIWGSSHSDDVVEKVRDYMYHALLDTSSAAPYSEDELLQTALCRGWETASIATDSKRIHATIIENRHLVEPYAKQR